MNFILNVTKCVKNVTWNQTNLRNYKSLPCIYQTTRNLRHEALTQISFGGYKKILPFALTLMVMPAVSFLNRNREIADTNINDIEDNITHLIILAKIALEKGDKDRAEAILTMGLKICEEKNITFGLPFMYDILATIALANGEIEKAENLLVTVIEKMAQNGSAENNHHIIDFKLRLSRIYSTYKENALAEIGFKTCLEAQKAKIKDGDVSTKTGMLYVNVLFWYGVHQIRNEHFKDAKYLLDTAYDYSGKIKGLSPYQEMVILYTLADLNLELGEYDIALMHMQNAVMLGKGISSSDLPRCYVKLGKIYYKLGVFDQAKSSVTEGIKLAAMFNNIDALEDGRKLLGMIEAKSK